MIEAGEYVRIKEGIFKVISIDELYIYLDKLYFDKQYQTMRNVTFKEKIVKHSKNIIDLIEVGDIVFIQDVLNNDFVYIYDDEMLKAVREDIEEGLQITQILTHEQYEENCYKITTNDKLNS